MEELTEVVEIVAAVPLEDMLHLMVVSFIPIGFLLGFCIFLLGLGVSGIMKIFKKI